MKIISSIVAASIIATSIFASSVYDYPELKAETFYDLMKDNKFVNSLTDRNIKVTKAYDLGSLVAIDAVINETTPDGKVTVHPLPIGFFDKVNGYFLGSQVQDSDGVPISVDKPINMTDELVADIKSAALFTLGKENKGKDIFVFTDPDCPACVGFEKSGQLETLAKTDTVYVLAFPLERLHPNARAKSEYLFSLPESERYITLKKIEGGEITTGAWTKKADLESTAKVNKILELGTKVQLSGTPFVIDSKGNKLR